MGYTPDTIDIDNKGQGAFFGDRAGKYCFKPELRAFIDGLVESAKWSTNRHFVIKGTTVYAAQASRFAALQYMSPDRILVSIEIETEVTPEQRTRTHAIGCDQCRTAIKTGRGNLCDTGRRA